MSIATLATAAPQTPSRYSPLLLYPLAIASVLLVLVGVVLLLVWLRRRRAERLAADGTQAAPRADVKRLSAIWSRFLAPLPPVVRGSIAGYTHFVVLGAAGTGKTTLVSRKVDWQGQASQFLPSYTADPLLQIYLGGKLVVQEVSAPLLASTSLTSNQALRRLWVAVDPTSPPAVIIALKAANLSTATPDQIRQQAQLMRGKINTLAAALASAIPVRICLTHMEQVRGYSEFARFLHRSRVPLELELTADAQGGLRAALAGYEKHLPRALATLPVASFEACVDFLRSSDDFLGPVASFVQELVEASVVSLRPKLQSLYFFSPPADEQVGNPFDPAGLVERRAGSALSWARRWLLRLGIRPLHALLGALLVLAGLGALGVVTKRHGALVDRASERVDTLHKAVLRAQDSLSVPSESDVVRRAEIAAQQGLGTVAAAEARWAPLRLIYRRDKRLAQAGYVESVRQGYLLPVLQAAVRQRSREKILYALAALYATRDNVLGALVCTELQDWSTTLGVPGDTLRTYVQSSLVPWSEPALLRLPPLPSESARWPITDLGPWRRFIGQVGQAVKRPVISDPQLQELRREADRLLGALGQVRKAGLMRRLFRTLSEESPLDLVRLFGADAGALTPDRFLTDHMETLDRLLRLVVDSSLSITARGPRSLFQLLRSINALSEARPIRAGGPDAASESLFRLPLPGEAAFEMSEAEWIDLLLRSRKRLLLAHQIGTARHTHHHRVRSERSSCERPSRRHHRRPSCAVGEPPSSEAPSAAMSAAGSRTEPGGERAHRDHKLPVFSAEELVPRLADLLAVEGTPADGMPELYSRAVFNREVLPLVQELKKAVSTSRSLTPEEKLALARLVQDHLGHYARGYCGALLRFYQSYRFTAGSPGQLHTALLDLVRPGSTFVRHLQVVADHASLGGLDDPYLSSLARCLDEFRPIVRLVSEGDGAPVAAKPAEPGRAGDRPVDGPAAKPGDKPPQGLQPYQEAVSTLLSELDGAKVGPAAPVPPAAGDKGAAAPGLAERLSPLGRLALAMHLGEEGTPLRKAEQFLDKAGVGGPLRPPFLAPFLAVHRRGAGEIEDTLRQRWTELRAQSVAPILDRFPFSRGAEREVAPAELVQISEGKGAFWKDVRAFFTPVLSEQGGAFHARESALGALRLPDGMLATLSRLSRLSRTLFAPDGEKLPLRLAVNGLPGRRSVEGRGTQLALASLQVGKATAYGFNQQPAPTVLQVTWWDQGVALVSVESVARSGRRQTQTLEVSDSAWSLFRLLQKSTLDPEGITSWRLLGDGSEEPVVVRFVLDPDPWALIGGAPR